MGSLAAASPKARQDERRPILLSLARPDAVGPRRLLAAPVPARLALPSAW
jgi:hypothetical protein